MPVVQDQNRILEALQGAVAFDITQAVKTSGTIQEANDNFTIPIIGSLAGGSPNPTTGSAVQNKFSLQSNAFLVFALLALVGVFAFLRR